MEDAHVCEPNMNDDNDTALYGVFDGHCGAEVARYVGRHISRVLKEDKRFESSGSDSKEVGQCLRRTFHKLDEILENYDICGEEIETLKNSSKESSKKTSKGGEEEEIENSGDVEARRQALQNSVTSDLETAKQKGGLTQQEAMQLMLKMMCLEKLTPKNAAGDGEEEGEGKDDDDDKDSDVSATPVVSTQAKVQAGCTSIVVAIRDGYIIAANAGDSRALLSRAGKAVALSWDHKPQSEIESSRIKNAGGFVSENGRVNGNLNLSRSIGDLKYKVDKSLKREEQIITAEPDIHIEKLDPKNDEFLILACDGIWDVLTRQECVDEVRKRILANKKATLSEICEDIVKNVCLAENTQGAMGKGCDNMTLMVVRLNGFGL